MDAFEQRAQRENERTTPSHSPVVGNLPEVDAGDLVSDIETTPQISADDVGMERVEADTAEDQGLEEESKSILPTEHDQDMFYARASKILFDLSYRTEYRISAFDMIDRASEHQIVEAAIQEVEYLSETFTGSDVLSPEEIVAPIAGFAAGLVAGAYLTPSGGWPFVIAGAAAVGGYLACKKVEQYLGNRAIRNALRALERLKDTLPEEQLN